MLNFKRHFFLSLPRCGIFLRRFDLYVLFIGFRLVQSEIVTVFFSRIYCVHIEMKLCLSVVYFIE